MGFPAAKSCNPMNLGNPVSNPRSLATNRIGMQTSRSAGAFSSLRAGHGWRAVGFAGVLLASTALSHGDPREHLAKFKGHLQNGELESAAVVAEVLESEVPRNPEVAALHESIRKARAKAAAARDEPSAAPPAAPFTPSPLAVLWQAAQGAESPEAQKAACEKIIKLTDADKPELATDVEFWVVRGVAALTLGRRDAGIKVANVLLESDAAEENPDVAKVIRAIDGLGWLKERVAVPKPPPHKPKAESAFTVKPATKKSQNSGGKSESFGGSAKSGRFNGL